jgi:hypothetical protein
LHDFTVDEDYKTIDGELYTVSYLSNPRITTINHENINEVTSLKESTKDSKYDYFLLYRDNAITGTNTYVFTIKIENNLNFSTSIDENTNIPYIKQEQSPFKSVILIPNLSLDSSTFELIDNRINSPKSTEKFLEKKIDSKTFKISSSESLDQGFSDAIEGINQRLIWNPSTGLYENLFYNLISDAITFNTPLSTKDFSSIFRKAPTLNSITKEIDIVDKFDISYIASSNSYSYKVSDTDIKNQKILKSSFEGVANEYSKTGREYLTSAFKEQFKGKLDYEYINTYSYGDFKFVNLNSAKDNKVNSREINKLVVYKGEGLLEYPRFSSIFNNGRITSSNISNFISEYKNKLTNLTGVDFSSSNLYINNPEKKQPAYRDFIRESGESIEFIESNDPKLSIDTAPTLLSVLSSSTYSFKNGTNYDDIALVGSKISGTGLFKRTRTVRVYDPISYEVVISTKYAEKNSISPISRSKLYEIDANGDMKYFDKFGRFMDSKFVDQNPNSYILVDSSFYPIVGIGTTPDFAYPLIDNTKLTINPGEEAIVFLNRSLFSRIYNSVSERTNNENYFSFKYASSTSKSQRNDVRLELEKILSLSMKSYSNNSSKIIDISEDNYAGNISGSRYKVIDSISSSLFTFSVIFSFALILICCFVISIMTKKKIKDSLKTIGILEANGVSRWKLKLIYSVIPSLFSIFPIIIGMLLSIPFVNIFLGVFDTY